MLFTKLSGGHQPALLIKYLYQYISLNSTLKFQANIAIAGVGIN